MSFTTAQIESLLFAAGRSVEFKEIAKMLSVDKTEVQSEIENLKAEYQNQRRGIRIVSNDHQAEMTTGPENGEIVSRFLDYEKAAISQAKLEALTVLAYRGPLTQAELEQIRGVNCFVILRNLKIDDLIDEIRQNDAVRYQVSTKFLKLLGVTTIEELPNYNNK